MCPSGAAARHDSSDSTVTRPGLDAGSTRTGRRVTAAKTASFKLFVCNGSRCIGSLYAAAAAPGDAAEGGVARRRWNGRRLGVWAAAVRGGAKRELLVWCGRPVATRAAKKAASSGKVGVAPNANKGVLVVTRPRGAGLRSRPLARRRRAAAARGEAGVGPLSGLGEGGGTQAGLHARAGDDADRRIVGVGHVDVTHAVHVHATQAIESCGAATAVDEIRACRADEV